MKYVGNQKLKNMQTDIQTVQTDNQDGSAGRLILLSPRKADTNLVVTTTSGDETGRPSPRPLRYTRDDFIKLKAGTSNVGKNQEMSSGLEFRSIAGASDLTDLGDLPELGSLQKKKKKGRPKGNKHGP